MISFGHKTLCQLYKDEPEVDMRRVVFGRVVVVDVFLDLVVVSSVVVVVLIVGTVVAVLVSMEMFEEA